MGHNRQRGECKKEEMDPLWAPQACPADPRARGWESAGRRPLGGLPSLRSIFPDASDVLRWGGRWALESVGRGPEEGGSFVQEPSEEAGRRPSESQVEGAPGATFWGQRAALRWKERPLSGCQKRASASSSPARSCGLLPRNLNIYIFGKMSEGRT